MEINYIGLQTDISHGFLVLQNAVLDKEKRICCVIMVLLHGLHSTIITTGKSQQKEKKEHCSENEYLIPRCPM